MVSNYCLRRDCPPFLLGSSWVTRLGVKSSRGLPRIQPHTCAPRVGLKNFWRRLALGFRAAQLNNNGGQDGSCTDARVFAQLPGMPCSMHGNHSALSEAWREARRCRTHSSTSGLRADMSNERRLHAAWLFFPFQSMRTMCGGLPKLRRLLRADWKGRCHDEKMR